MHNKISMMGTAVGLLASGAAFAFLFTRALRRGMVAPPVVRVAGPEPEGPDLLARVEVVAATTAATVAGDIVRDEVLRARIGACAPPSYPIPLPRP